MKLQWVIIFIYTLVGAVLLIANPTQFLTPVEINFIFGRAPLAIYPVFYLVSLFFFVIIGLIGILREEAFEKKINKLKAEVYDTQTEELKELTSKIETYLSEFMDEIDKRLSSIEEKLGVEREEDPSVEE